MNTDLQNPRVLESAWHAYRLLNSRAEKSYRMYLWMRIASMFFLLVSLLPFLLFADAFMLNEGMIKGLLVVSFVLALSLTAYAGRLSATGRWLTDRANAEETLSAIYYYRTILWNSDARQDWLKSDLEAISKSVSLNVNTEPNDLRSIKNDPGFNDLDGEEYYQFRLNTQLNRHFEAMAKKQREKNIVQALTFFAGILSVILMLMGGDALLWTPATVALTLMFIYWQELRTLDFSIRNHQTIYSQLTIIAKSWFSLKVEEQTQSEFFKMVRSTEKVLLTQMVEPYKSAQESSSFGGGEGLIRRALRSQRDPDRLLAEEASSGLVQSELASMRVAVEETIKDAVEQFGVKSSLKVIADEFTGVEIGPYTPPGVLNEIIALYPKTREPKG